MEQLFNVPKLYASILLDGMHYAKVTRGWSFPNHKHSIFEFIYCASGTMEQWVNGQPYVLEEGDALLVKSGLNHHTSELAENTEFFVFHFDVEMKEFQLIFQFMTNPLLKHRREEHLFNVSEWVKDFIGEYEELLAGHDDSPSLEARDRLNRSIGLLRMQMRILDFICLLAESLLRETDVSLNGKLSPSQLSIAHEVASQLEQHSGEQLQINELASKMGLHRSYISNCFKQTYGISPREYYRKIKIRSAKQLLQNTDLSIEEIAGKLEFSSPAHFSKYFLNSEGMPPIKFRNRQPK